MHVGVVSIKVYVICKMYSKWIYKKDVGKDVICRIEIFY